MAMQTNATNAIVADCMHIVETCPGRKLANESLISRYRRTVYPGVEKCGRLATDLRSQAGFRRKFSLKIG